MWGAIKADLLDFVNTVTEDTSKTLGKVLCDDVQDEDVNIQDKVIADLRRSYETYESPIKENDLKDFDKFMKKFSLSSYSDEIASVLDVEPEVSRYYAELVPISMTPDQFWARLFFRIDQVQRSGGVGLEDEEDEEELTWEDEGEEQLPVEAPKHEPVPPMPPVTIKPTTASDNQSNDKSTCDASTSTKASSHSVSVSAAPQTTVTSSQTDAAAAEENKHMDLNNHLEVRVKYLTDENTSLKSQLDSLLQRLAVLEAAEQKATQDTTTQTATANNNNTSSGREILNNDSNDGISDETNSSSPSAVLVSHPIAASDNNSIPDTEDWSKHSGQSGVVISPNDYASDSKVEPNKESDDSNNKQGFKNETAKYLAALDDAEDEEEDGWN